MLVFHRNPRRFARAQSWLSAGVAPPETI